MMAIKLQQLFLLELLTGTHEAFELRDSEDKKYLGKSVLKAIEKVNGEISKALIGLPAENQKYIDKL